MPEEQLFIDIRMAPLGEEMLKAALKAVKRFFRPWELIQDPERCLLEQGILCLGSATRSGCGVRCPNSNQGCRGCYGPAPGVTDQGAKFLSSVASNVAPRETGEIDQVLAGIPDPVGTFYRYGLAKSLLRRKASKPA